MSILNIFWIVLIISALQPVFRQRFLNIMRQRKIRDIEKQRGSRVILLVHRQETMSFLGFPIVRYIDMNDAEDVMRAVQLTGDDVPVDLVLHSPGGLVLAATQIARAIKAHKGKVTVFVPHMAMSGGTLIALGADEIVMCAHSMLGPIDPQVGQYPAVSVLKAVERKPIAEVDDATLILADIGQKAIVQLEAIATDLLRGRLDEAAAGALARVLCEGRWTHDYAITVDEARTIGLPVTDEMPDGILELMALFPQPTRMQPSVEYLPEPRPGKPPAGGNAI